MNRKVGVIMGLILAGIVIAIVLCLQMKGKEKKKSMFSKEIAPYSKRQEEQFAFPVSDEVNLKVRGSNVTVKQADCKELKIHLVKEAGDKKEELLNDELEKITCRLKDGIVEIGFLGEPKKVNSTYVSAELTVPDTVTGIRCDCQTGDIKLEGIYKDIVIDSRTGDVNLGLKKLDKDSHIAVQGSIGDVNIKLPKNSSICLRGTARESVKLSKDIVLDETGTEIQIDKEISEIRIGS